MLKKLELDFKAFISTAHDLGIASSRLNQQVQRVEELLKHCNFGVEVEMEVGIIDDDIAFVGYGRSPHEKMWRFYVRNRSGERVEFDHIPRVKRLVVVAFMKPLLNKLYCEAEALTEKIIFEGVNPMAEIVDKLEAEAPPRDDAKS